MNHPESAPVGKPIARWKAGVLRLRKPVLIVAGIGTVLGGLAGYVTMYRTVTSPRAVAVNNDAAQPSAAAPLSILVLPLANQTGDPTRNYLADGLTTAITGDLSRIQDAVIVPPVTAAALSSKGLTVQQLGTEARVRFVLQGAVSLSGDRIRVNAQLSDAEHGRQIWSEVFEVASGDLFSLQDDVTARIRVGVGSQMVLSAARDVQKQQSAPRVADLLLRLQALELQQQSLSTLQQAEALARQALAFEPTNPQARAALAVALWLQADNFSKALNLTEEARRSLLASAAAEAEQVLVRDAGNVRMLNILARAAADRGDINGAQSLFERALELDPRYAPSYSNFGSFLRQLGQLERARDMATKALRLPSYLPPTNTYLNLAISLIELGHYDEAIRWSLRATQADPAKAGARASLALAYAMKGDQQNARAVAAELLKQRPTFRLPLPADGKPWPRREVEYRDYLENKFKPAALSAGLPLDE